MPVSVGEGLGAMAGVLPLLTKASGLLGRLADATPGDGGPLTIRWDTFNLGLDEVTSVEFKRLQLASKLLSDTGIQGDLRLAFQNGTLLTGPEQSYFRRSSASGSTPLALDRLHFDSNCVAVAWKDHEINYWLRQVLPNFGEDSPNTETDVALRVIFGGPGEALVQEVRFDWLLGSPAAGAVRTFSLPGIKVALPATARFSLVLTDTGNGLRHLAFCVTVPQNAVIGASSNFAWERDGERELQNDSADKRDADAPPLFEINLTSGADVTVVLLALDLGFSDLPTFFEQIPTPIAALDFDTPASLCTPVSFQPEALGGPWSGKFRLNVDASNGFQFPFLNQDSGPTSQFITIDLPDALEVNLDFANSTIPIPIGIRLKIGDLELSTVCDLTFNWRTFAVHVDHDKGVDLFGKSATVDLGEYLGLKWRLKAPADPTQPGRFRFFTLVTKDYNYQIQQAPGAVLEIAFDRATSPDEPILFNVSDFVLGPKGISLTAKVTDQPAKLNGIDTRFRFNNSGFQIKENQLVDFTLAGSGPLPPDLVGDAMVDIALQFSMRDLKLKLIAGSARLKGSKLLDCKGTRFQFSVDAIGLKFVDDGKFHLYFTLTGSAQFTPQPGDDGDGPLALLGKIKIDLVECPLTGDAKVIAKHVKFLVELPKPKSFSFLGCFEMELRAIGFVPQAEVFDGDAAMQITGQLKFAQGAGDTPDARPDYHTMLIGLPKKGEFVPRIHFSHLPVNLNIGTAFRLNGVVDFVDDPNATGLMGEGTLEIQGLPTFAASFAFLRVRRDAQSPWLRAWFIYLEVRQISFMIPVVQIYLREVGLGFGYRFTLASIKAADRENDVRKLLKELKELSRTQGDLSKRDRWAIDLEDPGQDPRWTIVLRAMFSQTSASPSPLRWDPSAESQLSNLFLFDAIIALRSDLTFFMAVRGWVNTNYADYVNNVEGARDKALLSGFVLLSPRQKRFLANVSNNPGVKPGLHPPLPEFVREAIANSQFSATLLIEPGLVHFELGWPNMLRWKASFGPLKAEIQGGFILRVSKTELVIGNSFLARASLDLDAGFDFGIVGVRISAHARVAYGARYIGVLDFVDPSAGTALYGAIGLEAQIQFSIELWLKIELVFTTIKLSFSLSLTIGFTAGLEVGFDPAPGLRGSGTVALSAMGHSLQLNVKFGLNEQAVQNAYDRTSKFLNVGLEATEVEPVPGVSTMTTRSIASADFVRRLSQRFTPTSGTRALEAFNLPDYSIFVMRTPHPSDTEHWVYFVMLPQGQQDVMVLDAEGNQRIVSLPEPGFLPAPPDDEQIDAIESDFELELPGLNGGPAYTLEQWDPLTGDWLDHSAVLADATPTITWKADWRKPIIQPEQQTRERYTPETGQRHPESVAPITLAEYLRNAFKTEAVNPVPADLPPGRLRPVRPVGDPDPLPVNDSVVDERVQNPTDSAYEAAVRGAVEQFTSSPYFKKDRNSIYEQLLTDAFNDTTTIYNGSGNLAGSRGTTRDGAVEDELATAQMNQQAHQLRGMVIHDLIVHAREYRAGTEAERAALVERSIAFGLGLVFRVRGNTRPVWLDQLDSNETTPRIRQRSGPDSTTPGAGETAQKAVRTFNVLQTDFGAFPPQFQRVQQFTDANTIALAWDLTWDRPANEGWSGAQQDPDQHLMHYHVRRRSLDSRERELSYTVKPAQALHRTTEDITGESVLKRLKPRFQIVDHFTQETLDDLAALPATGRSYLYTITPVDFAGNVGQPLTLVATRYPNQPPRVPVNGELIVTYRLSESDLGTVGLPATNLPRLVVPAEVEVEWSEPSAENTGPKIAIAEYRLIFRRERTLPIGSYGLDGSTQGPRAKMLPTSNARPLPSDIKIVLDPQGLRQERRASISIDQLRNSGVLPADRDANWRPEAWRVFFQTVSANGVPSALAPVQLLLRAESANVAEDGLRGREERRPAQLEWLPQPQTFEVLPPEDERAIVGTAHFPMPLLDETGRPPRFGNGPMGSVGFREHPAGIRCIRFRWNQGPSAISGFPLELNAGYHLLELDVDAHTTSTFENEDTISNALRELQEIQMLPGSDLLLAPGDTLNTSQWEAWYPSSMIRNQPGQRAVGSELPTRPWYSWRESILEWPVWPGLTENDDAGMRATALHPVLQALVGLLGGTPALTLNLTFMADLNKGLVSSTLREALVAAGLRLDGPGTVTVEQPGNVWHIEGTGTNQRYIARRTKDRLAVAWSAAATTYDLDLQISPPIQPMTLAELLQSTAPKADPYGWGVLQRFGLAVGFALRREGGIDNNPLAGEVVTGAEMLGALEAALAVINDRYADHLHVELLFQPARSVRLEQTGTGADDLLALVQISLRPAITQHLRYGAIMLDGPAGAEIDLQFNLNNASCSVINQADPASGQDELTPSGTPIRRTIRLPLNGRTTLLMRSVALPDVHAVVKLTQQPLQPAVLTGTFANYLSFVTVPSPQITVRASLQGLDVSQRAQLREALAPADRPLVDMMLALGTLEPFAALDERSSYFIVPQEMANAFAAHTNSNAGKQWLRFKRYAEALNGTQQPAPTLKIDVPVDTAGIDKLLPDFRAWSQRFFDHSGDVAVEPIGLLGQSAPGPWLATAYPRAGSPAYATPDASGRLQYDHLLEDKWAHVLRYYIRPYGRYDLLWQSFRQSPALRSTPALLPSPVPAMEDGGLDVVLERTHPVAKPLVLSSRRLDPEPVPGQPAAPGQTWEVLVAQHHEQVLIEHNQTLARQLEFRQVAFTLMRRFAYPRWMTQLGSAFETTPPLLQFVQDVYPALPTYPATPDHLDLDAPLTDADARSLDLPLRMGAFGQGALALQWEALPFFYEHRLLLVAQSAAVVSPVNEVFQRDFEYRTPLPGAAMSGIAQTDWLPPLPFGPEVVGPGIPSGTIEHHTRLVSIPLRRFWDSLPAAAQARWASEAPDAADSTSILRKPASLPDPEVIYQLVEEFGGNVEVQAELFFQADGELSGHYERRQLGKRFLADLIELVPPPDNAPQSDYVLKVALQQIMEEELSQAYNKNGIPTPTRNKIAFNGKRISVLGALRPSDLANLHNTITTAADRETLQRMFDEWYSEEPISHVIDDLPRELTGYVDFLTEKNLTLVWTGGMTESERSALQALPGDPEWSRRVAQLVAATGVSNTDITTARVVPGLESIPEELRSKLIAEVAGEANTFTALVWTGAMSDAEEQTLLGWPEFSELRSLVDLLVAELDATLIVVPIVAGTQLPSSTAIQPSIRNQLSYTTTEVRWKGRLRNTGQLGALQAVGGDAAFKAAIATIVAQLSNQQASIDVGWSVRPTMETLPEPLRAKLLLAHARVRYHGIMTPEEALMLQSLYELPVEHTAIQRLYNAALNRGLRGRRLVIGARRGNAAPSPRQPFDITPLSEPSE